MPAALDRLRALSDVGVVRRLAAQPYPLTPAGISVSERVYERSLSAWNPILAAAVYLLAVHCANQRWTRAKRAKKPLPDRIKGSKILSGLVLFHNTVLAAFSAWSFYHAAILVIPYFVNGFKQAGTHGFRHAYCTVPTDDPRGLGRYVWLFYMSKYYEIVDSVILTIKGKRVSELQAYHHAGAIAAMWSGTRYSANAIWIFLLFNSGIHTMMYTYFILSTLRVPGARALKQAMTTAQIAQLFFGCIIASFYLLVRYSPVAFKSVAPPARHIAPASVRKPGKEGQRAADLTFDRRVQISDAHLSCCSSTGQVFAVILNVAYLIPLIVLFVRFYLHSYLRQPVNKKSKPE